MKDIKNILTFFALVLISCNSQTAKTYDQEAIALNNQAVDLILTNPDSALLLLNKATEIDSNYYVAFNNKISVYCSKGDYGNAIKAAKQGIGAKPDLAESISFLGMLYDFTGQADKANEQYQKAINIYNNRLTNKDKNNQANRINRAHTLLLLGNREAGQKEIQALLNEFPEDSTINLIVDFDKEKYLNDLFNSQR